jgi:hypothetical protein
MLIISCKSEHLSQNLKLSVYAGVRSFLSLSPCDVLAARPALGDLYGAHSTEERIKVFRSGIEERFKRSRAITHCTVVQIDLANLLVGYALVARQTRRSDARQELIAQLLRLFD